MAYVIFDLDGTAIDTSHRYRNKPCGAIDLDFWFANSTAELIARDTLLPLANSWKRMFDAGHTIIVCTARDFSANPLVPVENIGEVYEQYLADNGLQYHHLLHRTMAGPDHLTMGDGALKTILLNNLAQSLGYSCVGDMRAIMFDDNQTVIDAMIRERVYCFDAVKENARITLTGGF